MKKTMTSEDIAKGIKNYNKVGYKKVCHGWYSDYMPIVVIGETEKSYRCAVVEEEEVASTFDPKDKYFKYCFTNTYHANHKKPTGKTITIPKRDFDKYFTTEHCAIYDYAR